MGKSHPPSPDFKGAAEQTAVGNHPNINTPYGSYNWTQDANGQWTGTASLNQPQQQALQSQQALQEGRLGAAQEMMPGATSALQNGVDFSKFGTLDNGTAARDQAIQGAYSQATSRLDPQWAQRQTSEQQSLANQGLAPGSQAYQNEMGNFNRAQNDAYTSAMNAAIGQGTAAQQATFGENLQARQQGINEAFQNEYQGLNAMNALGQGQGVSMPTYTGMNTPGADYMGAAQNQYQADLNSFNANQMQKQDFLSGIGQIGGTALSLPFSF